MTIKAPSWCSNAVPTNRGWEDPDAGELYVSGGFKQSDIDEFFGVKTIKRESVKVVTKSKKRSKPKQFTTLTEAPVANKSVEDMTEVEAEATAEHYTKSLQELKEEIVEEDS